MALLIQFDKKHLGFNGLIPLRRGDDWELLAVIQEKKGTYVEVKNLTGHTATGFFKNATGTELATCAILQAECGSVKISLPKSATPNVVLAPEGTSMYVILEDTDGNTVTVEPEYDLLEVKDRGFTTG